tara:strand:+ start:458 stop:670 length:213 start_codon:yes stop_codon:yes gene_type:complete
LKPNKDLITDDEDGPTGTDGSSADRETEKPSEKKRRKSSLFKTSRPPVEKIVENKETKKGKRPAKKEKSV